MSGMNSVVAVYKTHADAEDGIGQLQRAAFDLKTVSLLGKEHDYGGHVVGYYKTVGGMRYCGARGAFWNGLWKLLPGAAYFAVPGIGGVLIAGNLTVWFVATLECPVEGLTAVGSSLCSIGIPRASAQRYDSAVKMHRLLLVMHGAANELLKARDVLRETRPDEIDVHLVEMGVRYAA
jgi:hypothetical protein